MFKKLHIYIAVFVLLAYNIVSIGLAYRAGQRSVQHQQLNAALVAITTAIDQQKAQHKIYAQLSDEFAAISTRQHNAARHMEDNINAYLQTLEHRDDCIEPDAVRLLNQAIDTANAAATTSGSERAYPLR
ncbi:hypothetical protein [Rappaport israeli]|uniref:hypothetical protein n=1 Tax=Rappaport israeli TaxID=1839807 RepID=UPI000930D325|nr:hypothetical protein [Rappaport israeli]